MTRAKLIAIFSAVLITIGATGYLGGQNDVQCTVAQNSIRISGDVYWCGSDLELTNLKTRLAQSIQNNTNFTLPECFEAQGSGRQLNLCEGRDIRLVLVRAFFSDSAYQRSIEQILEAKVENDTNLDQYTSVHRELMSRNQAYRQSISSDLIQKFNTNGYVDFDDARIHQEILNLYFNDLANSGQTQVFMLDGSDVPGQLLSQIHQSLLSN